MGFNFSAVVYIDGNSIRDHTGPPIFGFDYPLSIKEMSKCIDWTEESTRQYMSKYGICNPDDEPMHHTTPPIVTNRNAFLHNRLAIQHPLHVAEQQWENCCSFCHQNGKNLRPCADCRKAFYCSKTCQQNHWKLHKYLCRMFKSNFIVSINMAETMQYTQPPFGPDFDPSLEGIGQGPKPDRKSSKRFIVKLQCGYEYSPYNPYNELRLYDRSVDIDVWVKSPVLYHLIMECGVLCAQTFTVKKIFCWASFADMGRILNVYTDNLPPYEKW